MNLHLLLQIKENQCLAIICQTAKDSERNYSSIAITTTADATTKSITEIIKQKAAENTSENVGSRSLHF